MTTSSVSPVTVYSAAPQARSPIGMLAAIGRDIWGSRELSWRLFVRDLSAQYRQSLLGVFWAFAPPIVTSLIFIFLQTRNVVSLGDVGIPYPLFVLVGTLLWQMFVEAINAPLKVVTAAKPMMAKINFPREALIVSAFYTVLYGLLTKSLVIVVVLLVFDVTPSLAWLAAAVPMLLLVLCGLCVGLLVTPVGMLYADVASGLPVVTQLLFFLTPVVYALPDSFPFSVVKALNPMAPLLTAARDLLTRGYVTDLLSVIVVGAAILALGLIGLVIFRTAVPILIERTSA